MSNYKIQLKKRSIGDTVRIPVDIVQTIALLPVEDRNRQFAKIFEMPDLWKIADDIDHMKGIINWTPASGLPLTEMAKWFELADKVNAMKDKAEDERILEITDREKELIETRLKQKEFILSGNPDLQQQLTFIKELCLILGIDLSD